MTILTPDLIAAVRAGALSHFPWCAPSEHDYEEPDRDCQQCKATTTLPFPDLHERGDEISSFEVELVSSPADVALGVPSPLASLGFNGHMTGGFMASWKLVPLAMALLSADAHVRGDVAMERAYLDAANEAIDARMIEAEHAAEGTERSAYVVAERQVRVLNRSEGPYSYVEGLDPEVDVMPWPDYQAERSVEAGTPAFVVQHTTPGHWQVASVATGKSVDGIDYTSFETAAFERDLRNAGQAGGAE